LQALNKQNLTAGYGWIIVDDTEWVAGWYWINGRTVLKYALNLLEGGTYLTELRLVEYCMGGWIVLA